MSWPSRCSFSCAISGHIIRPLKDGIKQDAIWVLDDKILILVFWLFLWSCIKMSIKTLWFLQQYQHISIPTTIYTTSLVLRCFGVFFLERHMAAWYTFIFISRHLCIDSNKNVSHWMKKQVVNIMVDSEQPAWWVPITGCQIVLHHGPQIKRCACVYATHIIIGSKRGSPRKTSCAHSSPRHVTQVCQWETWQGSHILKHPVWNVYRRMECQVGPPWMTEYWLEYEVLSSTSSKLCTLFKLLSFRSHGGNFELSIVGNVSYFHLESKKGRSVGSLSISL